MKRRDVIRAAAAVLLGCAGGAPGRDIPVYREYTQPIRFYDDEGELLAFSGAAPDLAARQAMHDAQAQAVMMGQETVLEMAFGTGASMLARPVPIVGKQSPMTDEGGDLRRRKEEANQNWLAKSLSLPSLGQKPDSAAETAMAAGAKDSGWGWLAGEIAGPAGDAARKPEPESPEAPDADPAPEREDSPGLKEEEAGLAPPDTRQNPTLAPPDLRNATAVADMSQTRQALSDLAAGMRPEYAALPASVATAAGGAADDDTRFAINRLNIADPTNAGLASVWGNRDDLTRSGTFSQETFARGGSRATWQGGWSAQSSAGSVLSRIEAPPEPVPVAADPVTTYLETRPRTTSGGYKPAWY